MTPVIITIAVAILLCLGVGFACHKAGYNHRIKIAEAELGRAEEQAKKIVDDAKKEAEDKKRVALVEAKEEILKSKNEAERVQGPPERDKPTGKTTAAKRRKS